MILTISLKGCFWQINILIVTVKPVVSGHSKIDKTKILHVMADASLMKVESIAESSPLSMLQYILSALSDCRSFKKQLPVFILSGRLRQVSLHFTKMSWSDFS